MNLLNKQIISLFIIFYLALLQQFKFKNKNIAVNVKGIIILTA